EILELWKKVKPHYEKKWRKALLNSGGKVHGKSGKDKVPAYLTKGEYVINDKAAQKIGYDNLDRLNAMRFANGGLVDPEKRKRYAAAAGRHVNDEMRERYAQGPVASRIQEIQAERAAREVEIRARNEEY